jgi:hypothetical protein
MKPGTKNADPIRGTYEIQIMSQMRISSLAKSAETPLETKAALQLMAGLFLRRGTGKYATLHANENKLPLYDHDGCKLPTCGASAFQEDEDTPE